MPGVSTGSIRESADRMCRFRPVRDGGFRVAMEVTRRCNIACLHCFVPNQRAEPALDELREIIVQLGSAGCRKLILTGGEPLLRDDLEEIIRMATRTGVGVDLNSNLFGLTEERADSLVRAGLAEASTSFYGDSPFHDRFVRRQGAYESTLRACRLLRERELDLDIHGPVWADNLPFVDHIYDLALSVGADSLTLFQVVGLPGSTEANLFGATRFDVRADAFQPPSRDELMPIVERLRRRGVIPVRTIGFEGSVCEECEQAASIVGLTSDLALSPCLLSRRTEAAKYVVNGENVDQTLRLLRDEVSRGLWQPVCHSGNPDASGARGGEPGR